MELDQLRYPIGKYEPQPFSTEKQLLWINDIQQLPSLLQTAVQGLTDEQLLTPYRPEGWTVQQLVHHIADSHINAYTRFKLGLTETNPTIKPYDEEAWALLPDTAQLSIQLSIQILQAVHARLVVILNNMTLEEWERTVVHPEHGKQMSLWYLLGNYAWHGRHHTAHITRLRERMSW